MKCVACGGKTRVIDTDSFESVVIRIRKCTKCGLAVTTDEQARVYEPAKPQQAAGTPAVRVAERQGCSGSKPRRSCLTPGEGIPPLPGLYQP